MAAATELPGHQVPVLSQGDRRLPDHCRLELDRTVLGHLARAQPQRRHFASGGWLGWGTGLHRLAPCKRCEGSQARSGRGLITRVAFRRYLREPISSPTRLRYSALGTAPAQRPRSDHYPASLATTLRSLPSCATSAREATVDAPRRLLAHG